MTLVAAFKIDSFYNFLLLCFSHRQWLKFSQKLALAQKLTHSSYKDVYRYIYHNYHILVLFQNNQSAIVFFLVSHCHLGVISNHPEADTKAWLTSVLSKKIEGDFVCPFKSEYEKKHY